MRRNHEDALAAYQAHAKAQNLSAMTVERTVPVLRAFLATARKPLSKVTRADVERFLAGRNPERLAHELSNLRVFFRCALGDEAPLPTDGLKAKRTSPPSTLVLTKESVKALLAATLARRARRDHRHALRDRAVLELLYGAGLRASEVRAALVTDLDLTEGTILVRRAKRSTWRTLPLPKAALPHLRAYLQDARLKLVQPGVDDGCRLFLTRRGRPLHENEPFALVKRLARLAGLPAHPHAFRRAVATHLVRDGVPVPVVQELLGHASLSTTARYVSVDRSELHQAVACLDLPRG